MTVISEDKANIRLLNTKSSDVLSFPLENNDKNFDPRIKRTRQLLVQAFKKLMEEKEFQKITIQDITELATVNRATFYAHFEDKYDLFDQVIREHFQEMLSTRFSPSYEVNKHNLRRFILTAFEFLGQIYGTCNNHPRRQFEPLILAQAQVLLQKYLLKWFEQQKFAKFEDSASQEVVTNAISWTIFGAALDWNRNEKKVTAEDAINRVLNFITAGLNF